MAEFGSHHSSVAASRPSLFEVLAEENLAYSLRSAFRHSFKIFSENFPHRMGPFLKYFEEIFTVSDLVFQYIHMRMYGATFPEHFYGLKRMPDPRQLSVSEKHLFYSLVLSIGFPYLQLKLENLYKKLKEEEETLPRYKGLYANLAVTYLKYYPSIHFLWEAIGLCYYLGFAVKKVNYHSPLLHMCKMQLVTATEENQPTDNLWEEIIRKNYSLSIAWKVAKSCVSSATIGISLGAFFLQFLEWWYNRKGITSSFAPLPIPPPPAKRAIDAPSNICPICLKPRLNATALACSGYVFCYRCIFEFVQKNQRCPVTGYSAELNQLIRIYQMEQ